MKIETYKVKKHIRYRVRFTLPSGNRPSRSFRTRDEAKIFLAKAQLDSGHVSRPKITFKEFCRLFLEEYSINELQEASRERYRGLVELYLVPYFGNCLLEDITLHSCQVFGAKINGDTTLSQSQKNFVIGRFKSLLNRAVKYDYLVKSPALALHTPRKSLTDVEYWSSEEVAKFMASVRGSSKLPIYMLAFNTGMRVGEIFGLKWDAIDLDNGFITIRRIWDQKIKGIKETTKTHSKRQFGINQMLLNYLRELKLKSKSDFVIDTDEVGCLCPSHASRYFRADAKNARVKDIRFHAIRHTFATIFVSRGGDIHQLAKILGHSSTTMSDRYAHFARDVAAKVSEIVSFAPPSDTKVLSFGQGTVMKANVGS